MKVSIIGAGGLVGSCAAFALQCGGVVRELALLDVNADAAAGQALDLLHGGPSTCDQRIRSGGYELVSDADVICITAGLRRKPDESRLDLISRNPGNCSAPNEAIVCYENADCPAGTCEGDDLAPEPPVAPFGPGGAITCP